MPLDSTFLKTAYEYFDPYTPSSGTEHISILLYSMARMTRPRVVVEYGSGHSTLYILRALADNANDFEEEKASLIVKTQELLESGFMQGGVVQPSASDEIGKWFAAGGKACAVNPSFYLKPYEPHLYSFEQQENDHPYVQQMQSAISDIGHDDIFTHLTGQEYKANAIPIGDQYIDWAWNDLNDYQQFFVEFWPRINPDGGLLIFHNTVSVRIQYDAIQWMKKNRAESGEDDLEILFIEEPHKLNQNGCTILRKTSKYSPTFHLANQEKILGDLLQFAQEENII
ncbi:MAG: hypothetical protein ACI8ZM_003582 [Crocinitomix sp.]|jgi:hypothetical protein